MFNFEWLGSLFIPKPWHAPSKKRLGSHKKFPKGAVGRSTRPAGSKMLRRFARGHSNPFRHMWG